MWTCSRCGATPIDDSREFCFECMTPREKSKMNTNPENNFTANNLASLICPNCQQNVVSDASFCLHCGFALRSQNDTKLAYTKLLEDAFRPYRQNGYEILQQSEMSITMGLPKKMNIGLFIVLLLLFFPAAIVYAILFSRKAYESAHFRINSSGKVEASGFLLKPKTEAEIKLRQAELKRTNKLAFIAIVAILIISYGLAPLGIPFEGSLIFLSGLASVIIILEKNGYVKLPF